MTEVLTESFCERCGTKYTFEGGAEAPSPVRRARTLVRGLRYYLLSDDPLDEALAEARRDDERDSAGRQLDAFHQTFNFCIECRQYVCGECWNEQASRCLTCAPMPGRVDMLGLEVDLGARLGPAAAVAEAGGAVGEAEAARGGAWPVADLVAAPQGSRESAQKVTAEAAAAAAVEAAPAQIVPGEAAASAATPVDAVKAEAASVETVPAQATRADTAPVETAQATAAPADTTAAEAIQATEATAVEPATSAESAAAETAGQQPTEPASIEAGAPSAARTPPANEAAAAASPTPDVAPANEAAAAASPTPDVAPANEAAAAEAVTTQTAPTEDVASRAPAAAPAAPVPIWQIVAPEEAAPVGGSAPGTPPAPGQQPPKPSNQPRPRRGGGIFRRRAPAPPGQPSETPPWRSPMVPSASRPGPPAVPPPAWVRAQSAGDQAAPGNGLWEDSARGVVNHPESSVQACVSCGLPLSATARFCRRCGAKQG